MWEHINRPFVSGLSVDRNEKITITHGDSCPNLTWSAPFPPEILAPPFPRFILSDSFRLLGIRLVARQGKFEWVTAVKML